MLINVRCYSSLCSLDELPLSVHVVDRAECPPKSCLFARMSSVHRCADPIQNDSDEQLVDCGQQGDRAIVDIVVHVSLLVQEDDIHRDGALHSDGSV